MKNKNLLFFLFACFFSSPLVSLAATATTSAGPFSYTPLENIPGFEGQGTDFYQYISSVYKFGIWAVGIAALLMIAVGGYMYITSAGNNTSMEKAKSVITDAVVGVILALVAYLLLYVINPDLVKITKLPIVPAPVTLAPAVGVPGAVSAAFICSGGGCGNIDTAVQNNSFGINPNILKSILAGGEGCNPKISTDGHGSCGYSQALPDIRTACGISGSASETCTKIQSDPQLDVNCAAWLINSQSGKCGTTDIQQVACCYNGGPSNADCHKAGMTYANKVTSFYNTNCK